MRNIYTWGKTISRTIVNPIKNIINRFLIFLLIFLDYMSKTGKWNLWIVWIWKWYLWRQWKQKGCLLKSNLPLTLFTRQLFVFFLYIFDLIYSNKHSWWTNIWHRQGFIRLIIKSWQLQSLHFPCSYWIS